MIQLPSDSCMENADLKDEYCLEKTVADGLGCFFLGPGGQIEGTQYQDCNLTLLCTYLFVKKEKKEGTYFFCFQIRIVQPIIQVYYH